MVQVLSANTQGQWKGNPPRPKAPPAPTNPPLPPYAEVVAGALPADAQRLTEVQAEAEAEARRVVLDLFLSDNLLVLAGLGTSLGVKPANGSRKAPTMSDLWALVRDAYNQGHGSGAFNALTSMVEYKNDGGNIEELLSRCRMYQTLFTGKNAQTATNFADLAERTIVTATSFVRPNDPLPAHIQFLRRIARRSSRKQRAKLFTTNYDRCFEEAARQARLVTIDGFSNTVPSTFDAINYTYDIVRRGSDGERQDFIPNLFHLYKLHGSIDWTRDETSREVYKDPATHRPVLIYPRSSKYELAFEPPYLEMIAAFQASLREPNTGLLVVGFGFNDNHLAGPIMSAIRSNLGLKVAVVGPYLAPYVTPGQDGQDGQDVLKPGEAASNPHMIEIAGLARSGDARVALINESFESLIQYVPDLVAQSDMEKHVARLRSLGEPI